MGHTLSVLTQDRLKQLLDYDPVTGVFIRKLCRKKSLQDIEAGCVHSNGYFVVKVDGRLYRAHRLAWLYVHGSFPDGMIDHIDGNRLNNAISNLRNVSQRENQSNRKAHRNGKLVGATYDKASGRWRGLITVDRKRIRLGMFSTEEEAHAAYMEAKKLYVDDTATNLQ